MSTLTSHSTDTAPPSLQSTFDPPAETTTTTMNEAEAVSETVSRTPSPPLPTQQTPAATPAASATASPPSSSPRAQRRDVEDGKHYASRKSLCPRPCKEHTPTLEELQKYSFSEYIRQVVLEAARVEYEDDVPRNNQDNNNNSNGSSNNDHEKIRYIEDIEMKKNGFPSKCPLYTEGMAKVTLPKGFCKEEGIGQDRTGRGPAWQKGTPLGDLVIPNPIKQCVRGIGGVYEYTLLDRPPIALHAFRDLADAYQKEQMVGVGKNSRGVAHSADTKKKTPNKKEEEKKETDNEAKEGEEEDDDTPPNTDDGETKDEDKDDKKEENKLPSIEEMERKFWKRLGPTMPPATYGADMEGSLFGDDPANGWNLGRLDSFLQLLGPSLPGVTSPYLYMGMWASVFAVHTEDMNLLSINYLHAGAPKIWYAIAPGTEAKRLEALAEHYFAHAYHDCKQFLRHKRCLLSPMILRKAGIKFTMQVQYPGDAMITIPGGYHFGFNTGFNVAEATNFGVPEWMPFGHEARICNCRPDSVRIDMFRLERLLARYTKENKKKTRGRRKSFRDWGMLRAGIDPNKKQEESESESESEDEDEDASNNPDNAGNQQPRKPRMKDFWVEVMLPVPSAQRADYGRRGSTSTPKKPPASSSKKSPAASSKKRPRSKGKGKPQPIGPPREIWHLAKPMTRKGLVVNAKVLVFIPGVSAASDEGNYSSDSSDSDDTHNMEEDEQCFAGVITEFTEEHCRVHFDRLPKDDDVWMHINSSKLFLDGGRWDESNEQKGLPPRTYWQEVDSKRRCV